MTPKKLLFFSPYAFISLWAYPEAIIAENFIKRGHDVVQLRCRGLYSDFCIAMSAINLTPRSSEADRKSVCKKCNSCRVEIEERFGLPTVYVDDYVTDEMLGKIDLQLKEMNQHNWVDLEFDGIPIPRYASYEYILNQKMSTTRFSPEAWPGFVTHVRNAMITAEIGRRFLAEIRPDALLVYHANYGCNHVVCRLSEDAGIPFFTMHAGAHLKYKFSEMTLFKGIGQHSVINRSSAWQRIRDRPLSTTDVYKVSEHVNRLMDATSPWVYTVKAEDKSPQSVREFFKIRPDQKVLLVTMASGDERFAAALIGALPAYQEPIFSSQIAWLQALAEWIKDRTDLFLIIRVHPREFPNKREQVLSEYSQHLRDVLVNLPENCAVNWPEDLVSLHDLVKICDVGLNATSTAGLELLLFGIPVVIYDQAQLFSYPHEINLSASSVEEYWLKIDEALRAGRSLKNVVNAFRWIAFKSDVASIDISDVFAEKPRLKTPPRSIFSRFKDRFKKHRAVSADDEYYINGGKESGVAKNAHWLAYAVENDTTSHLDAMGRLILDQPEESALHEQNAVAEAALRYFQTVSVPTDIFESVFDNRIGRTV